MPEIVKLCYDSIKLHAGNHKVVLLNIDNYDKHCILPAKYEKMLKAGNLTAAEFADVLRVNLFAQQGGLWLDATIYVTEDISDIYFSYPFYSIKLHENDEQVSKCRWTGYCLGRGTKDDYVFGRLAAFYDDYTSRNKELIDYLLLDYALDYLYDNFEDAQYVIDAVPLNNPQNISLYGQVCSPYSEELFERLTKDTIFFKLRYRANEESFYDLIGDEKTIFAHMCKLVYNGTIPFGNTKNKGKK